MTIDDVKSYEDLVRFLSEWTNFNGDPPYDFIGAYQLLLTVLDNLSRNRTLVDMEALSENSPWLNAAQREYLEMLLRIG
jgi:hypothetical protein